ncbi:MAG TPA: gephyrin-like molybdotransferase Glp [Methylomirabilota bacterium]|nr:gephyrin-like molybdotransferase Glp [Methylomirabilota bacterium]
MTNPMFEPGAIVGCVLAGGSSSRMGAPDKGLSAVGGRPILVRVLAVVRAGTGATVLSANGDPARFAAFGVPVVADPPGERAGPLAGVLAGMDWAAKHRPGARFLLTAPSDTPFLPDGLCETLADAAGADGVIAVAASDSGRHPVLALWPLHLREPLRAALAADMRRLGAFVEAHPHRLAHFAPLRVGDRLVDPFLNVNTPADLAEAERIAAMIDRATAAPPPPRRLADDCFAPGRPVMTHAEAVALIVERVAAVAGIETVPLAAASGRVLAEAIVAPRDVPLADNAAVDGYAFLAADYDATGGFMPVADRIQAGRRDAPPVPPGAAVRIFTGAAMPEGVDTVAMQEDCETHQQDGADFVIVPPGLAPGANRRLAGEDVAAGGAVMQPGLRLRPQDIAALASMGFATVALRRRLSVALASTGDEVVRPGSPIAPGQVYDANHALISALVAAAGAEVTDLGVIPDHREAVRETLRKAASLHHLVITSGGVSTGEADHVAAALDGLGRRHLWKIAIKPGRPLTLGQIGDCAMLGLPGNPVAAFAGFLLYGLPLLARLSGADWSEPRRWRAPAAFSIAARPTGRREFMRGILVDRADGGVAIERYARDGSSLITGLRVADGFIDIPEDRAGVAEGDLVDFLPFSAFGLGIL